MINKEDYKKDIVRLKKFLNSKRSVVLRQMQSEMEQAADVLRYEDAAKLRDRIKAIESLSLSGDVREDVQPEVFYIDPQKGLEKLADLLGLEAPPRCMECVDIAHLQGEETVGGLICFIDGKPFKSGYRRFQIKSVEGVDDYASIREVIRRRYRYAADGEELYPDVILIDGGLGQLHAGLEVFEEMDIRPPMVISLAKREEEVYIQARTAPVRLPRNNPALRVLQQMRAATQRFPPHHPPPPQNCSTPPRPRQIRRAAPAA